MCKWPRTLLLLLTSDGGSAESVRCVGVGSAAARLLMASANIVVCEGGLPVSGERVGTLSGF